jgi:hypothetical protein
MVACEYELQSADIITESMVRMGASIHIYSWEHMVLYDRKGVMVGLK